MKHLFSMLCIHRYRLTVQANASCVDLLVWAAMEESTAESVLNRLADKIHSKVNEKFQFCKKKTGPIENPL